MAASVEILKRRAAVLRAVRRVFERDGFLEVETPARVHAPGQEIHLDAIPAGGKWLATSPEYAMKRLLAAGHPRLFQIGKAWRGGERGPHHQSEFTIVEWYRARAPLEALARDCERLVAAAARAAGSTTRAWRAPFARTTVRELVREHAGFDLRGDESTDELRALALTHGVRTADDASWDDVFFQVWLDRVEPHLGRGRPTFVFDWPAPLAALARRKAEDPRLAERFELYAGGLELANAFGELADPVEQRARFEEERRVRGARGKDVYPVDEKLLEALPRIEGAAGIALGFDRLVMLVLGRPDIRDVVAFSDDEV